MNKAWLAVGILPITLALYFSLGNVDAGKPAAVASYGGQPNASSSAYSSNRICDETCTTTGWMDTGDWKCAFSLACYYNFFDGYFVEQEKKTTCVYTCDDGYRSERVYYKRRWVRQGCCSGSIRSHPDPNGTPRKCP